MYLYQAFLSHIRHSLAYCMFVVIALNLAFISVTQAATDCSAVTEISQGECESLLQLYNSTDGANWYINEGWNLTNTPCNWYRITCDNGGVIRISLGLNSLSGTVPNFSNLPNLESLSIELNSLSGIIPNFSNLPNLEYLSLSVNSLSGTIPNFSNLPNLEVLDLVGNSLSGIIPNFSNLPNLESLFLDLNSLSGTIPNFSNLPNLVYLFLRGNSLSGIITDFSNLPNLESLWLNSNQLTGTIPNFNTLSNLESLRLDNNQLTGAIPNFSAFPKLKRLKLDNNQLTGAIPELSTLPNLEYLELYDNQLCKDVNINYSAWQEQLNEFPDCQITTPHISDDVILTNEIEDVFGQVNTHKQTILENVILTEDLQINIPRLAFYTQEGELSFWGTLRKIPTADGSLLWEVVDYGNETGNTRTIQNRIPTNNLRRRDNLASLQCLNRTNPTLTPDFNLCLPNVTFQEGEKTSSWWASLKLVPSEDGRLLFKLDDFGISVLEENNGVVVLEHFDKVVESNPYHRNTQEAIQDFSDRYLIFRTPRLIGNPEITGAAVVSYTPHQSNTAGAALANLGTYAGTANQNFQIGAYKRVLLKRLQEQIKFTQFETFQEMQDDDSAMNLLSDMEQFYNHHISGKVNTLEGLAKTFDNTYKDYKDDPHGNKKIQQVILSAYRRILYIDKTLKGKQPKYVSFGNVEKRVKRISKILKKLNTVVSSFDNLNVLQKQIIHTHLVLYVIGHVEALTTLDQLRERILANSDEDYRVYESHPLIQAIDELTSDLNEKNSLTIGFDWKMIAENLIAAGIGKGSQYILKSIVVKSAAAIGVKSTALIGVLTNMAKDVAVNDIKDSWVTFTDNIYTSSIYFYGFRKDFINNGQPKLLNFENTAPEIRAFQANLISAVFFNQMKAAHIFARSYLTREGTLEDKFLKVGRWGNNYDIEWADKLNPSAVIRGLSESTDFIIRNMIAKKGVVNGMQSFNSLFNDQNFDYFAWITQQTGKPTTLHQMSNDYNKIQQIIKSYLIHVKNQVQDYSYDLYFVDEGYEKGSEDYDTPDNVGRRYILKKTGDINVKSIKVTYVGDEPIPANEIHPFEYASSSLNNSIMKGLNVGGYFNYHGDYEVQIEYLIPSNQNLQLKIIRFNNPKILGYGQAIKTTGPAVVITHDHNEFVYRADFDMILFSQPIYESDDISTGELHEFNSCNKGTGVSLKVSDVVHRINPLVSYNDWKIGKQGDEWHYQIVKNTFGNRVSYARLIEKPVTLGAKDLNPIIPEDSNICVPIQPALYYLVTYNMLNNKAIFQMPIKVFTNVVYKDDNLSFNFPKEMLPVEEPKNFKAIAGNGQITLSWDAVENATYNVYWTIVNSDIQGAISVIDPYYVHTNLVNGTNYSYQVTAVVNGVESSPATGIAKTPISVVATPGIVNDCKDFVKAGKDAPQTHVVNLYNYAGVFEFKYNTESQKDRIVLEYEGKTLFDTGCVGTNRLKTENQNYSGNSNQLTVRVEPNCEGGSGTAWNFKVSCP